VEGSIIMDASNLVVVRGVVTSPPRTRELPSGTTVTNVEVTTRSSTSTASVPVVVHDRPVEVSVGDEVVVVGSVRRRFFRAGGVTQSRTEVVAHRVATASRRRSVERLLADAAASLAPPQRPTAGRG
jgi:single-strand DNA-binding protein